MAVQTGILRQTLLHGQKEHAKSRASERYGIHLSNKALKRIGSYISNGSAKYLYTSHDDRKVFEVFHEGARLKVVFDENQKRIVTFLPAVNVGCSTCRHCSEIYDYNEHTMQIHTVPFCEVYKAITLTSGRKCTNWQNKGETR